MADQRPSAYPLFLLVALASGGFPARTSAMPIMSFFQIVVKGRFAHRDGGFVFTCQTEGFRQRSHPSAVNPNATPASVCGMRPRVCRVKRVGEHATACDGHGSAQASRAVTSW